MERFIILIFLLLSSTFVSCEDCNATDCGHMELSHPFYVSGKQSLDCGLPGFQVSCKHNLALLNLSGDTYIIKNISYDIQTLRIVNSAFSHSRFECSHISSVHNLTLNNTPFEFNSKPREFFLLQDCSTKALKGVNYAPTFCHNSSPTNSSISLVRDSRYKEVAGECRLAVSVPYEDSGASIFEDKIRAGITLKWKNSGDTNSGDTNSGDTNSPGIVILISIIAVIVILLNYVCCIMIWIGICVKVSIGMKILPINCTKSGTQAAQDNRNFERFIRYQKFKAPKRYTYKEIKFITNNLREKLSEGGYSMVYKGKLLGGRLVAVKLLKQSKGDGQDFINEVASASGTNHVNVVSLLGFCFEGSKRCLVYEFMPNGSLEKYRRARTDNNNNQPLTWEQWFQISLGIARGLEYLHRGCNTRILHFDIKPHNILLGENFCPKISDFGLAKLCPQTDRSPVFMSEARGTVGYIAPEVFCRNYGDVSQKSNVYSYGMLVLEVIGFRENTNATTSSSEYFPQWIYKKLNRDQEQEDNDDSIMDDDEKSLQRKMILVSLWCIQTFPLSRPSMDKVVQMLEGSLDSIEVPPIPTLTSPPRPPSDPSGSSTITIDSFSEGTSES